jgi:hypothetical protein
MLQICDICAMMQRNAGSDQSEIGPTRAERHARGFGETHFIADAMGENMGDDADGAARRNFQAFANIMRRGDKSVESERTPCVASVGTDGGSVTQNHSVSALGHRLEIRLARLGCIQQ